MKKVTISITGKQKYDNAPSDVIELITAGNMVYKNGSYYITYKESMLTGMEGCTTLVKVDKDEKVSITRYGKYSSHLEFKKDKNHFTKYVTENGEFDMSVDTLSLKSDLSDKGGNIAVRYNLQINSSFVSENEIELNIKEM